MTILLYDYHELEERTSKQLSIWKAWHTILFICAAIFGILNYAFLQSTMQLVDNNCVFYPRNLSFHWVQLPNVTLARNEENAFLNKSLQLEGSSYNGTDKAQPEQKAQAFQVESEASKRKVKRDAPEINSESDSTTANNDENRDNDAPYMTQSNVTTVEEKNVTIVIVNSTHRLMLFTARSIFGKPGDCQFAEFMPLLSTVFAIVWAAFFIMCPGGGRVRYGLPRPWRILAPALVFALVLVALTGYGFTTTNGGLQAFCAAFHNYTNATTCSPVNQFLDHGWNATWGIGGRVAATRAAAAGVWVSWACAAALMLARCLAAPDFSVRKTGVYLAQDPQQKVTPYLGKSHSQRAVAPASPTRRDDMSVQSEPTMTTEVVTASVDHGPDSDPTSLATTPVRVQEHRF